MIGLGPPGRLGVTRRTDGTWEAICWAPRCSSVAVVFVDGSADRIPLERLDAGYFAALLGTRHSGDRYWLELDGDVCLADPASRSQPDGVLGPSALYAPSSARPGEVFTPPGVGELVIYELHIGTFRSTLDEASPGGRRPGTFATALGGLDALVALGVNAVEPMPIAAFPGERNWGYDGVFPFAVQHSYGGPEGFHAFVDGAHARGLAVILDVVYNHLGPEGSVHHAFGPYTNDGYHTPWGPAINVDRESSDEVRRYLLENATEWLVDFGVDGLRLDAIHGIIDTSARPFLAELSDHVAGLSAETGRDLFLIAESDDNNPRVLLPTDAFGFGMDSQWSDDFHHALHVCLTGERTGYYADYEGTPDLAKAIASGYSYTGQYSVRRKRRHGAAPTDPEPRQFTVSAQNHDQVGNRPNGERLSSLVDHDLLRVAAGVLCCSPQVPLVFMGEEYAEQRGFCYFVDHADPHLLDLVRAGRAAEIGSEGSPDPGAPETFARSCLDPDARTPEGDELSLVYASLLALRRETPVLTDQSAHTTAYGVGPVLSVVRSSPTQRAWFVANFAADPASVEIPSGTWSVAFASRSGTSPTDVTGPGSVEVGPKSFACYLGDPPGA